MSNDIEITISSKDKTKAGFESSSKAARGYGESMGALGEKTDASEAKILGMKDTVDGVATIMKGPGEQGIAAYLQGWADLASGIANFVIPALTSLSKQMIKNAAQAVKSAATHVASVARMVAAWIIMGIQAMASAARIALAWLIAMGPIALVIIAIAAVIAIIVLLVKNWDKVRAKTIEVAKAIGSWIAGAARSVASSFMAMIRFISGVPGRIAGYLLGMFYPLGYAFTIAWRIVSGGWSKFVGWVGGWKRAFNFSGMFNGIIGAFKSAINAVIGGWNRLSFSLPSVDTHIPGVGRIGGWSISTPNIPYLAKGGHITRGGRAVVGENGAEVVDLPTGATVHPHGSGGGESSMREMAWQLLLELLQNMIDENDRGIVRAAGARR